MNGNAIAATAVHRNQRARSSLCRQYSHAPSGGDEEHQHARVGHHPHRPVDDPHVRHVVAAAVLARSCCLELVEALDLAVERAGGHVREEPRDRDREPRRRVALREAADLEEREAARLAGVPLRLGGGDLHALRARDRLPEAVADHQLEQRHRAPRRSAPASPPCGRGRRRGRAGSASSRRRTPRSTRRSDRRASCARRRAARTRSTAAPRRSSAAPRRSTIL